MIPKSLRVIGCAGLLALAAGCSAASDGGSGTGATAIASPGQSTAGPTAGATATAGQLRYLFVQSAESAAFRASDDGSAKLLDLVDVSRVTFTFTEEPYRDTGALPTKLFVESFAQRFPGVSPNATVSSLDAEVGEFPVALGAPALSGDGTTVTYPVTALDPEQQLPATMGPVSVFIDPEFGGSQLVVEGQVSNGDGAPVEGATVSVSGLRSDCDPTLTNCDDDQILASATTDSNGFFTIIGSFSSGTTYYLVASKTGHTTTFQTASFPEFENSEYLVLPET